MRIPRKADTVGDAGTVTAHGMVDFPGPDQSLHGSPDRVCHFGFERAHNDASTGWGLFALGIKPEITPQPVDFPTYPRTLLVSDAGCCLGAGRLSVLSGWSRVVAVWAVVASLTVATAAAGGAQGGNAFGDIEEAGVHARSVEALAEAGIVGGTECSRGRFCPDEPIDRWVMAVWLVRAVDGREPSATSASRSADVDSGRWWVPHVERLAVLGITSGCATGPARFCPGDSVTRAQMATFLTRAFGL